MSSSSRSSNFPSIPEDFLPGALYNIREHKMFVPCNRIQAYPEFYDNNKSINEIVPDCHSSSDFTIKYTFPIIPFKCDGEYVDFLVGCDYYFINKEYKIGYTILLYSSEKSLEPEITRYTKRPVDTSISVEKRMFEMAKLLFEPTEDYFCPKIFDLNCDLPKFYEYKKSFLEKHDIQDHILREPEMNFNGNYKDHYYIKMYGCYTLFEAPPTITLKKTESCNLNNDQRNNNSQIEDTDSMKGNADHSEIDDEWIFQDYRNCYEPIPKKEYDFLYFVDKQEDGIKFSGDRYHPVIAFRGVFQDRVFFFYGKGLFVVSKEGEISPASVRVSPYCYIPYYIPTQFRSPNGLLEKIIVRKMKKYLSKKSYYQKDPVDYLFWWNYGAGGFGIESAQFYRKYYIPMGDIEPHYYEYYFSRKKKEKHSDEQKKPMINFTQKSDYFSKSSNYCGVLQISNPVHSKEEKSWKAAKESEISLLNQEIQKLKKENELLKMQIEKYQTANNKDRTPVNSDKTSPPRKRRVRRRVVKHESSCTQPVNGLSTKNHHHNEDTEEDVKSEMAIPKNRHDTFVRNDAVKKIRRRKRSIVLKE